MVIVTHAMLSIYSNDGSTQLYYNGDLASGVSLVVNENGLINSANTQLYTYAGNKKFIGFATTANATEPVYAIGDSTPSLPALDIFTLYIVEEELAPPTKIKSPVIVIKQKVKQVVVDNANMTIDIYTNEVPAKWIFGVSGLSASTPELTRTDDAVGKTYSLDTSTGLYTTDFDNVFNFERITDSDGNVFARIPKMYRKYTGGDTMQIANYKVDDSYLLYPSFIDDNGNEIDYFDYGCYKGSVSSSKLQSKSGVTPQYSTTIANFRTYARANNTTEWTYFQKDFRARGLIQDLFMIVFATRQTNTILGSSTWKSYGASTGDTDSISNSTLTNPLMCCGLNSTSYGFKFFGIEDICANGCEFVDGIYFSSSSIYVGTKPSTYADSTSNKVQLSYTRPTSEGYITALGYDSSYPFFNYPQSVGGSESTYYCDNCYYSSYGTISYDGATSFYAAGGLWFASGSSYASRTSNNVGSRLCRQPLT